MICYEGVAYVFGGVRYYLFEKPEPLREAEALDLQKTEAWEALPNMCEARKSLTPVCEGD